MTIIYNVIRDRLTAHGKTQAWLILQMRDRGLNAQPPEVSNALNGISTTPKAKRICEMTEEILDELDSR